MAFVAAVIGPSPIALAQETLPGQPPAQAAPAGGLGTYEQQLSYSLGLNIGADMRANGVPIDLNSLAAGIADALAAAAPKLTDDQRNAVLVRFQQEMVQRARTAGARNKQAGEAFLAENAKAAGVKTTASGLQYRVLRAGAGATPKPTDSVRAHYEGRLINGSVFDSSYERGEPSVFPVGRVIAGWTEALQLMKVGAKWELFIPSDIAYGAEGRAPSIGPNETLLFTIELVDVLPAQGLQQ